MARKQPEPPRISEAEWEIMRLAWEDDAPRTAKDFADELGSRKEWSEATIKTLLNRLVNKGALGFEVEGKRYLYHPIVSRESCVRAESESFIERVFGGAASPALAHFLERSDLTRGEIAELKRILKDKEPS